MADNNKQLAGKQLMAQARKQVRAAKKVPNLSVIANSLSEMSLDGLSKPDRDELWNDQSITQVVDAIMKIINKYQADGIKAHIGDIEDDIIKLGAYLVNLAVHCSYKQNDMYYAEENIKFMDATIYAKTNQYAFDNELSLTVSDYSSIARNLTKNERQGRLEAHMWDRTLSQIYFSSKQFLECLKSMPIRFQ